MEDSQIRKTSLFRIDTDMLSGTTPSACASSLIPALIQKIITSMDGHRLKYIDISISGIWERKENTSKEKKE